MKPTVVTVEQGWLTVRADFALKDHLKSIPGARFSRSIDGWANGPAWCYPATPSTAIVIKRTVPGIDTRACDHRFLDLVAQAEIVERAVQAAHDDEDPDELPQGVARRRPWRHQAVAYWQARERGSVIIPMRMGTGKSAVVAWLIATPELEWRRVLISCPLSVCGVWPSQIAQHAGRPARVVVLEGSVTAKQRRAQEEMNRDWGMPLVLVVNHESLWREPLGPWALRQTWDAVVIDESHRGKSPGGKLSMFLNRLRTITRHRIGLTGTPMPHSPLDIYAQGRFVNPEVFGSSFVRMRARYCNTPDAPIWMADQTFKPIEEVKVGDLVMGWNQPKSPAIHRTLEVGTVEAVGRRVADNVIKVTMESGAVIKCTADHRWLSAWHKEDGDTNWVEIKRDSGRGKPSVIAKVVIPPRKLSAAEMLEAAWLGGIYDGEGSGKQISQSRSHNPDICKRIESALDMLGIEWVYQPQKGHGGTYEVRGGLQAYVNLLNWLPITKRHQLHRLILKSTYSRFVRSEDRPARMHKQPDRVVKIEALPPQEVVSLQTSTGNYFAWGYASKNCVMGGYQQHQVVGWQHEDEFAEKLRHLCTPVVRAEDVLDLPPVQHIRREVVLSPVERKVYGDLERDMIALLDAGLVTASNALVKLLRLAQVCQGVLRTDDGAEVELGTSKRDALADLLEDLEPSEPVVVFGRFHSDLDATRAVAEQLGRRYAEVSGRSKGGLTDDSKMRSDVDVLGVQIQSGGVGIDLSRACYAVYLSVGYSLGDLEQSLARVHRPGQTRPTFYYHLVARDTVDEDIAAALDEKRDVVEGVLRRMRTREE